MNIIEKNARDYCVACDLDPDEIVWGTLDGLKNWCSAPRWMWYKGTSTLYKRS